MLTEVQKKVLRYIVQILQKNRIKFQITGGLAAIIYGAKRDLFDIDIDVLKIDIIKVRELFKKYITEDFHRHHSKYFDIWVMTITIDGVMCDISQGEDCFMYDEDGNRIEMGTDLPNPTFTRFEGMEIPVEPKDELISYKKILGRKTDLVDIKQIES